MLLKQCAFHPEGVLDHGGRGGFIDANDYPPGVPEKMKDLVGEVNTEGCYTHLPTSPPYLPTCSPTHLLTCLPPHLQTLRKHVPMEDIERRLSNILNGSHESSPGDWSRVTLDCARSRWPLSP